MIRHRIRKSTRHAQNMNFPFAERNAVVSVSSMHYSFFSPRFGVYQKETSVLVVSHAYRRFIPPSGAVVA
jgi:hypothetical protein